MSSTHLANLVDLPRGRALHQPGQRIYTFLLDGERAEAHLTYAELDRRARAIAAQLQEIGAAGERALLLYPPGLDYIAAFFGCLYAGVVAVPAYPPDPARLERTLPRLRAIAVDAQPLVTLTTAPILMLAGALAAQEPAFQRQRWIATDQIADAQAEGWRELAPRPDTLAFLQYTSGSTSAPKGVALTHGNLLHNSALIAHCFAHTPESRGVIWLPPYHDMGLIGGIIQPLYSDFPVTLLSPVDFLQKPLRWLQAVSRERATTSGGPNFAYELCVRKVTPEQRAALDLSSWRVAFNGAEPIRAETLDRFAEAFAPSGFRRAAFYPCYGLAEATLIVSGGAAAAEPVVRSFAAEPLGRGQAVALPADQPAARALVGCGQPLPEQRIVVVDPESRGVCRPGQVGEIWVAGPSVASGYWNQPAVTAETFGARLAGDDGGPLMRTGDLGFVLDGELFVTGRIKDLLIVRGRNHYPQDIELTVERSHPALRPGCCAAFTVERDGAERLVIVQEVERKVQGLDLGAVAGAIRAAVAAQHELQVYAVALLKAGGIPKTSSGKIQRHACRAGFLAGSLDVLADSVFAEEAAEPIEAAPSRAEIAALAPELRQQRLERYLLDRVARVLQVAPGRIDPRQPISALGFDSLMSIDLQTAIEVDLGALVPVTVFFQRLSIADLAADLLGRLDAPPPAALGAPAGAAPADEPDGLTYGQQALYFIQQLAPASAAYNIARAVRIRDELDLPALDQAFQALVARHPALRSSFFVGPDGRPAQRTRAQARSCLVVEPAAEWDAARLDERLVAEAHAPFDLERDDLLRVRLFSRSAHDHVLLLVIHHIVADMWSLTVLLRDLSALYAAARRGDAAALPVPALTFADYARWQSALLRGPRGEQLWDYWRRQLGGTLPLLNLPTDRPRPQEQTFAGATSAIAIDAALTRALRGLSQAHATSLYTTLLATFALLLHRITGQDDLLIGSPVAGRERAALADLVGYLVNPLPLRLQLQGSPTFAELLDQTRQTVQEALEHQDEPFGLLVERLHPRRDLSRPPLVQVMFVMQNASLLRDQQLAPFALGLAGARVELGALTIESVALEQRAAQFDLTLTVAEVGDQLAAVCQYSTDLFEGPTIARLLGYFHTLLEQVAGAADRPVATLPLLSAAERQRALVEWNATHTIYPDERPIHQLIAARAAQVPDAIAVAFPTLGEEPRADQQLTYAELHRRAAQLAQALRARGVGPDVPVGVAMERSIELVVALLGVLMAGGAYVPIDPAHPAERIDLMLAELGAPLVLSHRPVAERMAQHAPGRVLLCDADWARIAGDGALAQDVALWPDTLAYVIYTSGSTGRPKGAMNSHAGIRNRLLWMQAAYGLAADDRVLQKTPFSFDVSVWEFFWPLIAGAQLVVARPEGHRDSQYLAALIAEQGITTIHFVPSMLRLFLAEPDLGRCAALRRVICSGEALPADLQEQLFQRLPAELHNLYGPTEAAVDVTAWACERGSARQIVPIGRPIANTQIYVLDARMQPVPVGVAGELYLGGVQLARGYLARPDLTAERFIPNPFAQGIGDRGWGMGTASPIPYPPSPTPRLYRTGDQARYLPDGTVEFLGRLDHQVKIRGFRIELAEVELALSRHPELREAAVLAHEGAGGEKRLVAYIVPRATPAPTTSALRLALRAQLPEYMVPASFVVLDALPLSPNGKLDRRALPAPDSARPELEQAFVAVQTLEEELLAGIWAAVLGRDQVGIDDNFFDLGGDSIRAIQVIARARERGLSFALQDVFRHQTVRALARASAGADAPRGAEIASFALVAPADRARMPDDVIDAYPLTMLQSGLVFHSEYSADYEIYVTSLHIRAPFDLALLQAALGRLLARHTMLRSSFDIGRYSQPLQLVHRAAEPPLTVVDLRQLGAEEQEQALADWVAAEKRRRFVWTDAPLVRFHIHRRGDDTFQFTLSEPYLDGWSVASLLTEVFRSYIDLLAGRTLDEAPLASSFRDYVVLEQATLASEESQRYWRRTLGDATIGSLPRWDVPREHAGTPEIRRVEVAIPAAVSDGVKQLARGATVPLKSALLAVHLAVISFVSGQADVLTGLLENGRPEQADGEKVLGIFLNSLPFRMRMQGGSWADLARRAYEAERELLPFRRFPIAELQRSYGGQPLFESVFNFTHFHAYQGIQGLEGIEVLGGYASEQTFFPLTTQFNLDHTTAHLRLALDYNTQDFTRAQVAAIGGYYLRALAAAAGDPARRYAACELLSEHERRQLLVEWNASGRDALDSQAVHQLVAAQAARTPDAIALVFEGACLSYRALDAQADRLAARLRGMGVGAGVLVGVCLERSPELMVALLGVLKAGGAYVPLDPAYPAERLALVLGRARAPVLLAQRHLLAALPPLDAAVVCLDEPDRAPDHAPASPAAAAPEDLAYVIFTSGSTGLPKGVQIPHRAVVNFLASMRQQPGLSAADRLLSVTTVSFDIAVLELFLPLTVGACVLLASRAAVSDGAQLARLLDRSGATVMQATPATWSLLLAAGWSGSRRLRLLCGGEALPRELAQQLLDRGAMLWNMYGPTETTIWSAICPVARAEAVALGTPIANTQLYLLDEQMRLAPIGVPGELYIGGAGVARGYLDEPALTAERFLPTPFVQGIGDRGWGMGASSPIPYHPTPNTRLYRTGDLVRRHPDGRLEFLGRIDHQVKIRGFRIELGEIEAGLARHPSVREVVVVAREDVPGEKRLVAYVVPRDDHRPATSDHRPTEADGSDSVLGTFNSVRSTHHAELIAFLRERLPEYMLPSAFVLLDALPLTPNGKVDRRALPAPDTARPALGDDFVAPDTPLEQEIARLWRAALRVDQVGVHDNFFALGGHSLIAMRIVSQIRETYQVELPLPALFEAPTIAGLAALIEGLQPPEEDAEDLAWMLDQVEHLSDEEVMRRLAEQGWG